MDHLRLVFSFLLIVSVTTTAFGSAIKAQSKPNGEELEERRSGPDLSMYPEMAPNRKDLEDQTREESKRKVDAGALIPGKDLTPDLLKEDDVDVIRQLVVGIENHSEHPWTSPRVYFFFGEAGNKILTDPLDSGKALVFHGQSKSVKKGIAGVLTYYIPHINSTLAVMFSLVPSKINWLRNVWNVKLYSGNEEADCEKYLQGFFFPFPINAGSDQGRELSDSGLRFEGSMMADSVEANLNIEVHPVEQK